MWSRPRMPRAAGLTGRDSRCIAASRPSTFSSETSPASTRSDRWAPVSPKGRGHRLLLRRAAQAAELADELAHRAGLALPPFLVR